MPSESLAQEPAAAWPAPRGPEDVLVLAGHPGEPVLQALSSRGERRVIAYLPPDAPEPPAQGISAVRTDAELWDALLRLDPPPQEIRIERVARGGFTPERHRQLADFLRDATVNRATFATHGPAWVRHALTNLRRLADWPSTAALHGALAGVPCVLVSPGPSLAKNIALLAELRERVLVVAGNRALRPLRQAGITPDLLVVSDPIDVRYQLEGGLLDGVKALVLDLVAHPDVCALPAARRVFYTAIPEVSDSTFAHVGEDGFLMGGGSVATLAFELALVAGCDPIVLVGQDLALSGDRYYVETAPDGATRIQVSGGVGVFQNSSSELKRAMSELQGPAAHEAAVQRFIRVPGWHGGEVETSLQFDTYRRCFGKAVARHPGARVLNATEGGAFIDGFVHVTLAEALAGLTAPVPEIEPVLEQAVAGTRGERRRRIEAAIVGMQSGLARAAAQVELCRNAVRSARNRPDRLAEIDGVEHELRTAVQHAPFIAALASAEVEQAQREAANATTLDESLDATLRLYRVISQAVTLARPILAETLRVIQGRAA